MSSTWRGTPSTVTLFLDSTSFTVPLPQWVLQRASGSFTYTSSPIEIFTCLRFSLSVMARGCHHPYVKTDRCRTDTLSRPVFSTMLYQKTASEGEIWLFLATACMVQWCLFMIPLLLKLYLAFSNCSSSQPVYSI